MVEGVMDRHKSVSNKTAQRTTRVTAFIFLVLWFALAYWLWPSGITFGDMTRGELWRGIGTALIVVLAPIGFALLWRE
jgi:hypothetical protein